MTSTKKGKGIEKYLSLVVLQFCRWKRGARGYSPVIQIGHRNEDELDCPSVPRILAREPSGVEPGEMNRRATTTQTSTETRATTVITWTNIFFVRGRDVNRYN